MSIDLTPDVAQTPLLSALVAEEIRALMARRFIKQSHMARSLGVTEQWLSVRLRGVQPIDLNDLQRIAGALGVEATELFPGAGPRPEGGRAVRHAMGTSPRRPEKTRPDGHPKRTPPHVATHRPARIAEAVHALTGRDGDAPALAREVS
jgi:transcriptional regulator with XRE-family HTH domain